MNDGLRRFQEVDRVISIHGYCCPTPLDSPFFLRGADCWGWATWRRGWDLYQPNATHLLAELHARELTDLFDFGGSYPYTKQLLDHVIGRIDSWDTAWYASAFLAGKLTLYPGSSLVKNIGMDGSGTHCGTTSRFGSELAQASPDLSDLIVEESAEARAAFERYFRDVGVQFGEQGRISILTRLSRVLDGRVHFRARE
jgi:hypothetical protein